MESRAGNPSRNQLRPKFVFVLLKFALYSGPNGELTPTATPLPVAYVIQRFGVLLAVNSTAHNLWPFLPVADAYTQQLAQHWIAQGARI